MLLAEAATDRMIGLAVEVHRHTGPGLLESVYELCLCRELADAGIAFARQVAIPVLYKCAEVGDRFKADYRRRRRACPGNQSRHHHRADPCGAAPNRTEVAGLDPAMRMSGIHVGLLLNFNVSRLVDGLHRYVV